MMEFQDGAGEGLNLGHEGALPAERLNPGLFRRADTGTHRAEFHLVYPFG